MSNGKKKYIWLGAAGAAMGTLLVYFSIFWPPVPRGWIQGAIGKRDVYRQAKLTDKDIGVAGTAKVTVDDIQKFLQSPEFKTLASNAQFNQLIADPKFQKSFYNNQAQLAQNQSQVAQNLVQMAAGQAKLSAICSPVCPQNFTSLSAMPGFHAMMLNSQFVQLASQSRLSNLVGNAALQQAMLSQAKSYNLQGQ